jgi:hypothetical protein
MGRRSNKMAEVAFAVDPFDGDIISMHDVMDPQGYGYNSRKSPNNLRFARSHEQLAGRNDPPLTAGVCLREPLETEDYWNWD